MSSSEVISHILDYERIKAATFASAIGVKPTQIYDLQSGKIKKISPTIADKISYAYPHYNKIWLLTGEGEMLNDNKCLLKDNSAVVNGSGNSVVSGENNKLEISRCQDDLEAAMREIQYLKDIIKEKDKRLEEKDKLIEEKERLINVLMNK